MADLLPEFAVELKTLLGESSQSGLKEQVDELRIFDRCRCGDSFCASFYTQPKPEGKYGHPHETIALEPEAGMLLLDTVDGRIVYVEIHDRGSIRDLLQNRIP
jgi:hypothetical protein